MPAAGHSSDEGAGSNTGGVSGPGPRLEHQRSPATGPAAAAGEDGARRVPGADAALALAAMALMSAE